MHTKTSVSVCMGLILALLLVACSAPAAPAKTQPNMQISPSADFGGSASTAIPVIPDATETLAPQPNTGAPQFPFLVSENLLPTFQVADLSGINALPFYQMAEDNQGVLHVVWGATEGLWHRQLDTNGQWSEPYTFPGETVRRVEEFQLLIAPGGNACVLCLDNQNVFQLYCSADGNWALASSDLLKNGALFGSSDIVNSFAAEFDPDGNLQILSVLNGQGFFLGKDKLFPDENTSLDQNYHFSMDRLGNFYLAYAHTDPETRAQTFMVKASADRGKSWESLELVSDVLFNGGYARLNATPDSYLHFMFLSGANFGVWISSQGAYSGAPLFNQDEMFNLAMKDNRYLDLSTYTAFGLFADTNGGLHFVSSNAGSGLSYVRLQPDNTWNIQKIQSGDAFNPILLVGKNNRVYFLWRTLKGLFFAQL